ncbi:hypothetical protein ACEQ8H_002148 [Pleosporales sp. CAS-2024a]
MSAAKPVALTAAEAHHGISQELRNNIYAALLSYGGVPNIESALDRQLAECGFKDELRRYVTHVLRSGKATTAPEAKKLAMDMIKHQMHAPDHHAAANGPDDQHYDLKIPRKAIVEGTLAVKKELDKVCDITYDDE